LPIIKRDPNCTVMFKSLRTVNVLAPTGRCLGGGRRPADPWSAFYIWDFTGYIH
jgi:hypothetical protein